MVIKSWFVPGTILVILLMIGAAVYIGSKTETAQTPMPTTPTPTTSTPTVTTPPPSNDTDAINQLLSNYHESVKTKSLDDLMSLFTDDATFNGPTKEKLSGISQIGGYYSNIFEREHGPIDIQVLEKSVNIEGSRATVKTKIASYGKFGTEFFELIKVKGIWKISSLTLFSL
jgi:ketosteroid isomerase-like protein